MITAVDTCVVVDVLINDAHFAERSLSALEAAADAGPLVASEMVYGAGAENAVNDLKCVDTALKVLVHASRQSGVVAATAPGPALQADLQHAIRELRQLRLLGPDFKKTHRDIVESTIEEMATESN